MLKYSEIVDYQESFACQGRLNNALIAVRIIYSLQEFRILGDSMNEKRPELPQAPSVVGDSIITLATTAIDYIPGGSVFTNQFAAATLRGFQVKTIAFIKDLSERVESLESRFGNIKEQLSEDEQVKEIIAEAIQQASKTSEAEKSEALKNLVLNSALNPNVLLAKKKMFLNILDGFSGLHLKLLEYFDSPKKVLEAQGKLDYKSRPFSNYHELVNFGFEEGRQNNSLFNLISRDLFKNELITVQDLQTPTPVSGIRVAPPHPSGSLPSMSSINYAGSFEVVNSSYTTKFGKDFLQFIRPPE